MLKTFALLLGFTFLHGYISAQGCSDAGFCTIGNFNAIALPGKENIIKHQVDISFIIATHGKSERFYQPQLNYRIINRNGKFYELRLPFNIAKNISSGISNSGIGDAVITYNSDIDLSRSKIDYSVGIRASLTTADKSDMKGMGSYPMYLQSGLGTTDLLAVANYTIGKYVSIGTGVQLPVLQYNEHVAIFPNGNGTITGTGFRRKPDVLLKLMGRYATGKFNVNAGVLGIFHLANDHYNTQAGKYVLQNSQGTTINATAEVNYKISKNIAFGFLFAEPLVTRKNIPDGLARSKIYAPKVTVFF